MFRKFLYELYDMMSLEEEFTAKMNYEIEFPESIKHDEQMCSDLLESFEEEVKRIAYRMCLKLHEK